MLVIKLADLSLSLSLSLSHYPFLYLTSREGWEARALLGFYESKRRAKESMTSRYRRRPPPRRRRYVRRTDERILSLCSSMHCDGLVLLCVLLHVHMHVRFVIWNKPSNIS